MLLLIPGPVQTRPEVRAAAAQDYAPWDNDFRSVVAEIRERVLAIAGGVAGEHQALMLQGCGHFIMEAALRTAYFAITGENLKDVNFTAVRGLEGIKETTVNVKGTEVKIAVNNKEPPA